MNAVLVAVQRAGAVVAPNIGPRPELYRTTTLAAGLGILGIVGVVMFTAQVLGANRRAVRGDALVAPLLLTLVLMVVPIAAGIVLIETGKGRALDRVYAYDAQQNEVTAQIAPQLETEYGVAIRYSWEIPTEDGDASRADITLPDGTSQSCFIVADGTYEIRCGNPTNAKDSTPLPTVVRSAGS